MRILSLAVAAVGALFIIGAAAIWCHWGPEFDILTPSSAATSTPSSIAPLLGKNAHATIGDMVYLNDVLLRTGPTPKLFVISGTKNDRMLVVSDSPNSLAGRTPLTVDIKGLICAMPSRTTLRKIWKLNQEQLHFFGNQRVYIAAESVKQQPIVAD